MRRFRLFGSTFAPLIASLAFASAAEAVDYCVGEHPQCPGGAVLVSGSSPGDNLQDAIDSAILSAGNSSVYVGPGVYLAENSTNGRFLARDYVSDLNLIGAGRSETILRRSASTGLVADFGGISRASTISDLTIDRVGTQSFNDYALLINNGTGQDLSVNYLPETPIDASSASTAAGGAVQVHAGSLLRTTINATNAPKALTVSGNSGAGTAEIDQVVATGPDVANTTGLLSAYADALQISRSRIVDFATSLGTRAGSTELTDSLLAGGSNGRNGIALWNNGDQPSSLVARRVTVVTGHPLSRAIFAYNWNLGGDPEPITLSMYDSLIDIPGDATARAVYCDKTASGPISLTFATSAYDYFRIQDASTSGSCTTTGPGAGFDASSAPPVFVDREGGDFSQRWDSPWLDKVLAPGLIGAGDLLGKFRVVRGVAPFDASGDPQLDLGAFEYQASVPVATISSAPATRPGNAVSLSGSATDADPGETQQLALAWNFGDGTTATGANPVHAWSAPGVYSVTFTATDPAGRTGSDTRAVIVTALDTTRPKIKVSKKPKKTGTSRKARVVFKANEKSTFKCKLDKGKWKKCRSPYKKTVKRGKHTLQIRATDLAGNRSAIKKVRWRVIST